MSKTISLLLILILTVSSVALFFPLAAGQVIFTYGGSSSNVYDPPAVSFTIANGSVLYDVGNFNLGLVAYVGSPVESMNEPVTLQTLGQAGVCSVSYVASWKGNQPIELYNLTLVTPEYLNGTSLTGIQSYFFSAIDLTHVPQGAQQITVTVVGGGYVWGGTEYYAFFTNASFSLDFTISSPPSSSATASASTTVDVNGAGYGLNNCPIVVDSENYPQIAYTDTFDFVQTYASKFVSPVPVVMYASWNGFGWSTQAITVGYLYSLVLDANNTPSLLYGGLTGLTYATWTGSKWFSQIVDANSGNSFGALAFDSSGNPHIAYDNGTKVEYASWTESGWIIQTVNTLNVSAAPFQLSLAFNQNNTPYILYGYPSSNNGGEIVNLATENDTGWNIQVVPLPSTISAYGNMVLDSKGYPHFICSQSSVLKNSTTVDTILYVSWNGASWKTQKIVSNVQLLITSTDTSSNWLNMGYLALDSHNNPHLTYTTLTGEFYNTELGELIYASWTGEAWNIQTITNSTATEPGFLALDSNGNPHISYYGPVRYFGYAEINPIVNVMYAAPKEPFSSSLAQMLLIIILVVVIVAVAAISLLLYRRNRKKQVSDEKTSSLKKSGQPISSLRYTCPSCTVKPYCFKLL